MSGGIRRTTLVSTAFALVIGLAIGLNLGARPSGCAANSCRPTAVVPTSPALTSTLYHSKPTTPHATVAPPKKRPLDSPVVDTGAAKEDTCEAKTRKLYMDYAAYAAEGEKLRQTHGPLKIAAFSRLWVPPLHGTGGMQYHALHLYSQLAAQGHTVHVFVTGGPHMSRILHYAVDPKTLQLKTCDEATAQLTIRQIPSDANGEYSVSWFANALRAFTELNSTVGGFHVAHSESWAGVPNVYQMGLPMAVTWHGSMLDWFRNEINLIVHNFRMKGHMTSDHTAVRMKDLGSSVSYEAFMLLAVPHHIVISDSAADDLTELNLVDPSSVHLIYNGVNPSNFRPNPSARTSFLSELGITDSPFVVGCGGRLEKIKGHAQLSRAMDRVLSQHRDVVLLVAGHGGESEKYERLKSKGLRVHLLGMMKQERLAAFYQSLDAFVDPFYQHHGLNTVMIEAVLSGVPLIATRLASAKTTVPCDDFGRTFALGDANDLADQIEYLKAHPEERARISKNVRERAINLFTSTTMALRYERLLYDISMNPKPLVPMTGEVVCKRTYPAMCFRRPQ